MRERQKIGRAPVQLNSDYLFVGDKFPKSIDQERYTKRIERACNEMIANENYTINENYGSRIPLIIATLPSLAKKHNVKLKRLKQLFEVI